MSIENKQQDQSSLEEIIPFPHMTNKEYLKHMKQKYWRELGKVYTPLLLPGSLLRDSDVPHICYDKRDRFDPDDKIYERSDSVYEWLLKKDSQPTVKGEVPIVLTLVDRLTWTICMHLTMLGSIGIWDFQLLCNSGNGNHITDIPFVLAMMRLYNHAIQSRFHCNQWFIQIYALPDRKFPFFSLHQEDSGAHSVPVEWLVAHAYMYNYDIGFSYKTRFGFRHRLQDKIRWGLGQKLHINPRRCFCPDCNVQPLCGIKDVGNIFKTHQLEFEEPRQVKLEDCRCRYILERVYRAEFPSHPKRPNYQLDRPGAQRRFVVPTQDQPFLVIERDIKLDISDRCGKFNKYDWIVVKKEPGTEDYDQYDLDNDFAPGILNDEYDNSTDYGSESEAEEEPRTSVSSISSSSSTCSTSTDEERPAKRQCN